MLVSLAIVMGMLFAAYRWFKHRGTLPGAAARRMRVVERLPVDTRRSILLVEIDGEELVVGIGTDSITPIKTLGQGAPHEA